MDEWIWIIGIMLLAIIIGNSQRGGTKKTENYRKKEASYGLKVGGLFFIGVIWIIVTIFLFLVENSLDVFVLIGGGLIIFIAWMMIQDDKKELKNEFKKSEEEIKKEEEETIYKNELIKERARLQALKEHERDKKANVKKQ